MSNTQGPVDMHETHWARIIPNPRPMSVWARAPDLTSPRSLVPEAVAAPAGGASASTTVSRPWPPSPMPIGSQQSRRSPCSCSTWAAASRVSSPSASIGSACNLERSTSLGTWGQHWRSSILIVPMHLLRSGDCTSSS